MHSSIWKYPFRWQKVEAASEEGHDYAKENRNCFLSRRRQTGQIKLQKTGDNRSMSMHIMKC